MHRAVGSLGVEHPELAAAQEHVGGRAVGDGRTGLMTAAELALRQMDAMGEQGARASQAGVIVDIQIARAVRIEALDPGDLVEVLGDVAVDMDVRPRGPQRPGQGQLLGRRRAREPGRDRIAQPPAPVPALQQGP